MKFELSGYRSNWRWEVSDKASGVVAVSPTAYDTEKEARSAIGKARKAFAGYRFAKVEMVDDA